jgi:REP element-mobilizing transposase RayT
MDRPLAYLITFSCYGARLHGSEDGSVDCDHNLKGSPYVVPDSDRVRQTLARMRETPYALDGAKRWIVLAAIRQVCAHREWTLIAAHVRMSHAHVVVSADVPPEWIMHNVKAYASRLLNAGESTRHKRSARHGSTRHLWGRADLDGAVRYVMERQGESMAAFPNTAP